MSKLLVTLVAMIALPAHASFITLDFNEFPESCDYHGPENACRHVYDVYANGGVTISPAVVSETGWAQLFPDALLASYELNGSGIMQGSRSAAIEVAAGGQPFMLESVDILNGLYNVGMSVNMDAYLGGALTASLRLFFPTYAGTPQYGQQTWLFDVSGASLGVVDRLVFTQTDGLILSNAVGTEYFMDNLTIRTVPEPGTLGLFAIALLSLCFRFTRRGGEVAFDV